MENASKALVMAGGILIGVILLSVFVLAIQRGGEFARTVDSSIGERSIAKFNAQFEAILLSAGGTNANSMGYRNDLTAHDLISIVNLATNYNEDLYNGINIVIDTTKIPSDNKPSIEKILSNSDTLYECVKIEYDENTGRIKAIEFKKK